MRDVPGASRDPFEGGGAVTRARPAAVRARLAAVPAWLAALALWFAASLAPVLAQPLLPSSLPWLPAQPLEERLHGLTDRERARVGLPPLQHDEVLAQAARHHAEEMARLGYFSHASPTPGRAQPVDRVAAVGGTHVAVGENLAALSVVGGDLAERAVAGWMESEDHRGNLLHPGWTHVGFGVHEASAREVYVVKVLAQDPLGLTGLRASRDGPARLALRFEIAGSAGGWVAVAGGGSLAPPTALGNARPAVVVVEGVDASAPTHLRLEWTADPGTTFVGQASGWFDPNERVWTPDWSAATVLAEVVDVAATLPSPDVVVWLRVEAPADELVVFVDGREVPLSAGGAMVSFAAPGRDGVYSVDVATPLGADRAAVWHAFEVVVGGGVSLRPVARPPAP